LGDLLVHGRLIEPTKNPLNNAFITERPNPLGNQDEATEASQTEALLDALIEAMERNAPEATPQNSPTTA